jgi:hypothetical protein
MQKFCHHCGKQLPIGAKFCAFCGTNLASLSEKPVPQEVVPPSKPAGQFVPFAVGHDADDDDSYIDTIDHLNIRQTALHVDIVKDQPIGESMGSVIAQGVSSTTPPTIDPNRPALDPKVSLEEFAKEAGTLRKS